MSSLAAAICIVSDVMSRLEYLLRDEDAPVKLENELRSTVERHLSELGVIKRKLLPKEDDINHTFSKVVIELAFDIENAIERYAAVSAREVCTSTTTNISSSSGIGLQGAVFPIMSLLKRRRRSLQDDIRAFNKKIDERINYCNHVSLRDAVIRDTVVDTKVSTLEYLRDPTEAEPSADELLRDHLHERSSKSVTGDPFADAMVEEMNKLRPMLLDKDGPRRIAILSMSPTVRTNLAAMMFNDPTTLSYDCKSINRRDFRPRSLLRNMFYFPGMSKKMIDSMDTLEFVEQLHKFQKENRCLFILEDVQSVQVWETLRWAFTMDSGNKIIITTPSEEVARCFDGYIHKICEWTNLEGGAVLKKISGLKDSDIMNNQEIYIVLINILKQCGGLPLAIIAFANILRENKREDWDKVLQMDTKERMPLFQTPSYDELPLHLKPCLLYLARYPPDSPLLINTLYLMWMAEGLIHVSDTTDRSSPSPSPSSSSVKKRAKIAKEYLRDLVGRNFVIIAGDKCWLHDSIRKICMLKGKEEGFLTITDDRQNQPKHVRSLFFVKNNNLTEGHQELLEWTRVLNFDSVDFRESNKFNLKSIDKLLYLRYLGFRGCYLQELKLSFNNFIYLETLDLHVNTTSNGTLMIIPNVLWKLISLRYLYFPLSYQSDDKPNKLKLAGLTKLKIIENFHASVCDSNELLQLEHLQFLKVIADGNTKDFTDIFRVINDKNLRFSSLLLRNFDCYSKKRQDLVKQFLECNAFHGLQLQGHIKLRIPKDLPISQSLTSIALDGSEFSGQDQVHLLQVLGRAQHLRDLMLCNNAILGKEIVISGDFIKLRQLQMINLQYLEKWELGPEAMPNLSILGIGACNQLEMLPGEVMERVNFTTLNIQTMSEEFKRNVDTMVRKQLVKGKNVDVNFF